jgi:hypothetical protein
MTFLSNFLNRRYSAMNSGWFFFLALVFLSVLCHHVDALDTIDHPPNDLRYIEIKRCPYATSHERIRRSGVTLSIMRSISSN